MRTGSPTSRRPLLSSCFKTGCLRPGNLCSCLVISKQRCSMIRDQLVAATILNRSLGVKKPVSHWFFSNHIQACSWNYTLQFCQSLTRQGSKVNLTEVKVITISTEPLFVFPQNEISQQTNNKLNLTYVHLQRPNNTIVLEPFSAVTGQEGCDGFELRTFLRWEHSVNHHATVICTMILSW